MIPELAFLAMISPAALGITRAEAQNPRGYAKFDAAFLVGAVLVATTLLTIGHTTFNDPPLLLGHEHIGTADLLSLVLWLSFISGGLYFAGRYAGGPIKEIIGRFLSR